MQSAKGVACSTIVTCGDFSNWGLPVPGNAAAGRNSAKVPRNPVDKRTKASFDRTAKGNRMQISSISSMPSIGASVSAPTAHANQPSSATVSATAPSSATATKPATQSSSAAVSAPSSSHGSSSATSASSSAQAAALSAVYSDTVGGKSYSGSVAESNGEYVASVPEPAGGQCQRIERPVGRKQSQYGHRRAGLSEPYGDGQATVRSSST